MAQAVAGHLARPTGGSHFKIEHTAMGVVQDSRGIRSVPPQVRFRSASRHEPHVGFSLVVGVHIAVKEDGVHIVNGKR